MLPHVESSQKIYFSNEYAKFRMIEGNRQLNEGKIKKIINAISEGNDMLKYYPIQVKENQNKLDILDGQHRFYICRHLQRPVFYVIVKEEKKMTDIARVNSAVEKWKNTDFINCYLQQGNKNYEQLRDFIEEFDINVGTALRLLTTGSPLSGSRSLKEEFENGYFEVKHMEAARALATDCISFKGFEFNRDRSFIEAIAKVIEAKVVTVSELAAAHAKYPELLTKCGSSKDYIYNLEQLYNHRKQKRTVIA